jgi:hypothetical protein
MGGPPFPEASLRSITLGLDSRLTINLGIPSVSRIVLGDSRADAGVDSVRAMISLCEWPREGVRGHLDGEPVCDGEIALGEWCPDDE